MTVSKRDELESLLRAIAERAVALSRRPSIGVPSALSVAESVERRTRTKPGRALLLGEGAVALSRALRGAEAVRLVDTSPGAAQLATLGGTLRTDVLIRLARAGVLALADGLALDVGDGVLFSLAAVRLNEDPWERFDALRAVAPETLLRFTVDLEAPLGELAGDVQDAVAVASELAAAGVDAFRVTHPLNDEELLCDAVSRIGGNRVFVEGAIRYRGDLGRAADGPALERYAALASSLATAGAHAITLDDPVGRLTPLAAYSLVRWIGRAADLPIVLHVHDTAGLAVASAFAAIEAGVEVVDVAAAPVAGRWSLPPMLPLVAALEPTERSTGERRAAVARLDAAWDEVVRAPGRAPAAVTLPLPVRVLDSEVPAAELARAGALWQDWELDVLSRREAYEDALRRTVEAGSPRSPWQLTRVARTILERGSEEADRVAREPQPPPPRVKATDLDPRERLVRRLAPFADSWRTQVVSAAERGRDVPLLSVGDGARLLLDGGEVAVRLDDVLDLGGGQSEVVFLVDGAELRVRVGQIR